MTQSGKKMQKEIINGDEMVFGGANGNYIRLNLDDDKEEIVKISEMKDDEEIIITGKQLKELQSYWGKKR